MAADPEQALRQSEEKYRRLIESLRQGYFFYRHDPQGNFTYLSPSVTEVLGYEREEFLKHYTEYLPAGPGRAAVIDHTERTLRGERQPPYEVEIRRKDGTVCVLEVLEEPILDERGAVASVEGIAHDITRRKGVEQELQESRRRLETLLSNLPGMAYRCHNDPDWTMEFASDGCSDLTGHPPDRFVTGGLHYGHLIHPDDRAPVWEAVQAALASRRPFELLYRIRTATGDEKWVWEKGRGVHEGDELRALEGFITDITDRKRAEAALARSEEKSRTLVEKINDCVFSFRLDDALARADVEYVGPQIRAMTGMAPEEFVRDPSLWTRGVHPDDVPAAADAADRLWAEAGGIRRLYRFRHATTGAWRWLSDTLESHADPDGRVRRIFGVVRDVTEAKEAEEALRRSKAELATYHDLITHDLSNYAMKLLGVLELLLSGRQGPLTANQEKLLRTANRQALELDRMAENARLLARLDRSALPEARSVSLRDVVLRAVETARTVHFDRALDLSEAVEDDLRVAGVPFLENILLNLVDNAVRYSADLSPAVVSVSARRDATSGRVITVVRGGVPDEPDISHAFERYVRGRRSSGSGLGLSVAREIVEHAGGTIDARVVPDGDGLVCEIVLALPVEA